MPTKQAPPQPLPQVIGHRTVPNPKGEVVDFGTGPVWLSLETCRCGYSIACPGVGYRDEIQRAWVCKKCGEPHTVFISEEQYEQDQQARIAHHRYTEAQATSNDDAP